MRYQDTWYWIDDGDYASKTAFTSLLLFFALAESSVQPQAPLLTLPGDMLWPMPMVGQSQQEGISMTVDVRERSSCRLPSCHSGRKSTFTAIAVACGFLAIAGSSPAMAVDPDKFKARTTADLVALCSADPAQENYVAAIHFCHGFITGAYQYYLSLAAASEANRFVCAPDPVPSRSQVIAELIVWARQNPQYMSDPPVDSVFRYLAYRYPCGQ